MKLFVGMLLVFCFGEAHAFFSWDTRVQFAKTWGCKSSGCETTAGVPDKIVPKKIALTFDDGPSATITPIVLDTLKKHNIKATFFVLGKNVAPNRAIIRRMLDEGHIVASHSWNHPNFWTLNADQIRAQILNTHQALLDAGVKPVFFRYPNGNSTTTANAILKSKGYKAAVGWHIDTCDWGVNQAGVLTAGNNAICNGVNQSVTDVPSYLVKKVKSKNGGLILMHDTNVTTQKNLPRMIESLMQDGYEFVQVDDKDVFPTLNK